MVKEINFLILWLRISNVLMLFVDTEHRLWPFTNLLLTLQNLLQKYFYDAPAPVEVMIPTANHNLRRS